MESTLTFNKEEARVNDLLIRESAIRKYIIDASMVFKWYYKKDEKDLRQAEILYGLLESDTGILLAPELLVYEILNVLRLKKLIDTEKINSIISDMYATLILIDIDKELFRKAFDYSRELDISFYDSIYISLSERYDAPLITADIKLYKAGQNILKRPLLLNEINNHNISY